MERDKYLAAVDRLKPHLVDWSRRIRILRPEIEAGIKADYDRVMGEEMARHGDESTAKFNASCKVGNGHRFMVREAELPIFSVEENWRKSWSDIEEPERNAFFKLFRGHIASFHSGVHSIWRRNNFMGDGCD